MVNPTASSEGCEGDENCPAKENSRIQAASGQEAELVACEHDVGICRAYATL